MTNKVQSVDRALSILELLSDYNNGLGITEIGERANLHKSTVHRLLGTLVNKGYVMQDKSSNKYKLTMKLFELGYKRMRDIDILSVSQGYTNELMKSVNEVVHLVIRDGTSIVYIDKVEADNTIRMASNIGRRSPLYSTAVGKAMMAFMDEEEIEDIWNNTDIVRFTEKTIIDLEELKTELEKIRELGYAEDDEENESGVRCIGAPVFNHRGKVEGSISISGPTIRVTKDKVGEFGRKVRETADKISSNLGYR